MGEGKSFLGEAVENNVRLTGVTATAGMRACLLWWAGDRHALESFSPRIRRPSLTGLNWIEAACILQCAEGRLEGTAEGGEVRGIRYTPWRGKRVACVDAIEGEPDQWARKKKVKSTGKSVEE